jgi:hypothetical protein
MLVLEITLLILLTFFLLRNTVFDAKRLIGRRFDDPEVKADMKNWPFTVVDQNDNPYIQVDFEGATKTYSPQGKINSQGRGLVG